MFGIIHIGFLLVTSVGEFTTTIIIMLFLRMHTGSTLPGDKGTGA